MNTITKTAHGAAAHPIQTDGMLTKAKMIRKQITPEKLSAMTSKNLHLKKRHI